MIRRDQHNQDLHDLIDEAKAAIGVHPTGWVERDKIIAHLLNTELWDRLKADETMLKRLVARGLRRELK